MPPRTHLARISALLYCGKVSIFFFERSASAPWSKMENVFFYFLEELPPHLLIIMLYLSHCCNRKKLHSWEWNAFITVYQVRTMQFEKSFRGIDFGAHTAGILCTFVLFEDQGMSGAGEGEHAGVADCGEEKKLNRKCFIQYHTENLSYCLSLSVLQSRRLSRLYLGRPAGWANTLRCSHLFEL